ncbi:hypothetical protein J7J13_04295 [bacterium]|nr:hypothetical protein [bacterium]
MIQENDQKIIIVSLAIFLLASFIFLAYTERRQHQLNDGWFLYFENPKDSNLDFTIENCGNENIFHWEVLADDTKINEGNINVAKGEKEIVVINEIKNKKVIIKASNEKDKKEIYKNL